MIFKYKMCLLFCFLETKVYNNCESKLKDKIMICEEFNKTETLKNSNWRSGINV